MRRLVPAFALVLIAGMAPAQTAVVSLDAELERARAEQRSAEAEAARLERVAAQARGDVERLRAEQAAAAQAIQSAEARITASEAQLRLASAYVAAHRQRLAAEQRPAGSLLAGLAIMARRPPLLAIAHPDSSDELVKVRILLDSTLPVIRSRTAKLSARLAEGQRFEQAAVIARSELIRSREEVVAKRQQFAALEQRALQAALAVGGQALSAGDVAISAQEDVERLGGTASSSRLAAARAAELVADDPAPPRPTPAEGPAVRPPFAYELPVSAPVVEGLAAVNASGVRSRGLTLGATRGARVVAPAAGLVRFSGPFHDYDGVLIIEHGRRWMTLLVNISSQLKPGERVRLGQPVGRALGPLQVELSQNGRRISPALIAGSSRSLSKARKGG